MKHTENKKFEIIDLQQFPALCRAPVRSTSQVTSTELPHRNGLIVLRTDPRTRISQPSLTRIMDNGHVEETNVIDDDNVPPPTTDGAVVFTYNSDFPTLPEAAPKPVPTAKQTKVWSRPALSKADVSTTFHLAPDERSKKVKSFGNTSDESKKAQAIASATKTRIELSESKDGELTVVVKGERAKVEEARTRIIRDLQTQASREIEIPKEHHGRLIGKEGALLRSLEAETNCRIQIPNRDGPSSKITITGRLSRSKTYNLEIPALDNKHATEHIVCPKNLVPFVRGPQNETYDRLTAANGVKINIPPPTATNEVISVTGEKEGVHRVAAEIRQILESKKNVTSIQVQVARTQHRYIIGQSRSGIHEVLRKTGVVVDVPSEESGSDQITLLGNPADLDAGLALVIERAFSVVTQSIPAPQRLHKHLIGPKGATLSTLVPNRNNVQIELDDSGNIFLEGSPEEVKTAFEPLKKEVARLQMESAIGKVKVHPTFHRHVIGRGGSLISKIKDQHGVQITIPSEETNSDEIIVEGKKEGVKKAVAEIRAVVKEHAENNYQQTVAIFKEFLKHIVGKGGATIRKLRRETETRIDLPESGSDDGKITVTGKHENVGKAVAEIRAIVTRIENEKSRDIIIPQRLHKLIIGTKGSGVQVIRGSHPNVSIVFPDAKSKSDVVNIRGDKAEVDAVYKKLTVLSKEYAERNCTRKRANAEKAATQLNKIQEELANVAEETIDIPQKVQARFFGNGRRLISDIEEECGGVRIRFPSEKSASTKVTIRGPAGDVTKAVGLLSALAKDKEENYIEDTVKAKPEFHRFLIGKGGSKIAKLRRTLNVRIMFPKDGDAEKETIHLLGKKEDVPKAKAALEEAIKQLSETVDIKITVDPKYYKNFLVRGAALIKEIQDQNGGVIISFPKNGSDSNEVTIRGSKQCVEAARARIEDAVEDYEKQITDTVSIPAQFHRGLLAGRGAKIHELQSKYNVSIRFPNNREEGAEGSDQVTISGRDTKVEETKEALLALVPISKVIQLPIDMHQSIIERGGETIRKMMHFYDVNISIPKDNSSEDITVTGQEENVEQALEALREKLAEYEAQAEDRKLKQWSMIINVPTDYHQKIIGQRGATITALKNKYKVNINVPRENGNDAITITGYEKKVKQCAAVIEEMISELRSMFTQEISLDARYHPRLIGQRGKKLKQVMDKFHVEIRLPRQGAEDPNLVIVAGKDENTVNECIDFLRHKEEMFLENYKTNLKQVGKEGATIRKLRDETETRIDLPESGSNDVKAVTQLNKIQEELANVAEETIEIPQKVQARFFGNGRRLISDIEEECGGVRIRFPSEKSESTKVTIRGPAGDVTKAVGLLSALAKDKEENYIEDTVKAKPEFHRFLIGKGGSKIAKLRDTLNVRIMFPKDGDAEKETIHLLGKKEDVPKAKAALEEAIKQLSETVDIKITVDPKYLKNFLVRGAALIKEIQDQNGGVIISFPKNGSDSNEVIIRGSKQCVEAARARIEDVVEDFENQITDTISIPAQFHRGLLAGRGAKIHELQSKYNVSIRFPNNREEGAEGSDLVTISGRDTKVEETKEALLALVPISKVIQLPIDMHRSIIGRGGETVRKLMQDYDVNISIPKDNSSENITVTGQAENVEQALEALREKLAEYEALAEDRKLKQWSMIINVPTDYHQKIIGQRGTTITALKEKYGVNINVPREDGNEAISITGYEEKAKECAAAIEKMISELRSMFTQEISLDARYHPRLIGQRGKNLKQVMDKYHVEIRLPRQGAEDPNLVIVAGKDENTVYDCIDFLRREEKELLLDDLDRHQYISPRQQEPVNTRQQHQPPVAIHMTGAPWQLDIGSSEQFPDMGASSTPTTAVGGAWGSSSDRRTPYSEVPSLGRNPGRNPTGRRDREEVPREEGGDDGELRDQRNVGLVPPDENRLVAVIFEEHPDDYHRNPDLIQYDVDILQTFRDLLLRVLRRNNKTEEDAARYQLRRAHSNDGVRLSANVMANSYQGEIFWCSPIH